MSTTRVPSALAAADDRSTQRLDPMAWATDRAGAFSRTQIRAASTTRVPMPCATDCAAAFSGGKGASS